MVHAKNAICVLLNPSTGRIMMLGSNDVQQRRVLASVKEAIVPACRPICRHEVLEANWARHP